MNKKKSPIKKKPIPKKSSQPRQIKTVQKLEPFTSTHSHELNNVSGIKKMVTPRFMMTVVVWTGITYFLVVGINENYTTIKSYFKPRIKNIATYQNSAISYVDPRDILTEMKKSSRDFVLIDVRDSKDFKRAYIKYSLNVPFNQKTDTFIAQIKEKANHKPIVLMPYSSFSTSGEQAVELLLQEGIEADLLKIGWNELYNFPHIWLPEHEWESFDFRSMLEDDLR